MRVWTFLVVSLILVFVQCAYCAFVPKAVELTELVSSIDDVLDCGTQLQYGSINFYFDSLSFGQAVRWETGAGVCSLSAIDLVIYEPASRRPVGAGISGFVWADNGLGLPGSVIASQWIPDSVITFYPSTCEVKFCDSAVVLWNSVYHTGFIPIDTADCYAALMDNGSGGANASSSLFIRGQWFGNGNVFASGDINWVQELRTCCRTPGACPAPCCRAQWRISPCSKSQVVWDLPIPRAARFVAPEWTKGSWISKLSVLLSNAPADSQLGTGGIDLTIWSDNNGIPGDELATFHLPHSDCRFAPNWTSVDIAARCDLNFGRSEIVYVGIEVSMPESDRYPVISDDGSSTINSSLALIDDQWQSTGSLYQLEYKWMVAATFCQYNCGNADQDYWDNVNISDAVVIINHVFGGYERPCHWNYADVDGNDLVTISDVVYLINYIFAGGPAPCAR